MLAQMTSIIETNYLRKLKKLDFLLTRKAIRKPATKSKPKTNCCKKRKQFKSELIENLVKPKKLWETP